MHKDITFMLSLLGATVSGKAMPHAEGVNWEQIFKIADSHQMANLLAYGALQYGEAVPAAVGEKLLQTMASCAALDARQHAVLWALYAVLEKAGADYMPIKGAVLKSLYPYPDMRFMVDGDVFIRNELYDTIKTALLDAGFTFVLESNHEYIFEKDAFQIELHKYLIPTYNDDLYAYYGDGWQLAKREAGHRYALGVEDTFVYLVTHFAKHYRDAGTGIKPLLDIWLYLQKKKPDMEYCFAELEKLGLSVFAENALQLARVWFACEPRTEKTEEMTRFILQSGGMGTKANSAVAKAIRNEGKTNRLRLVFPPVPQLLHRYPRLEKAPWLLPVYWVLRWFRLMFASRTKLKKWKQQRASVTEKTVQDYQAHMALVGLDIYNGRKNA